MSEISVSTTTTTSASHSDETKAVFCDKVVEWALNLGEKPSNFFDRVTTYTRYGIVEHLIIKPNKTWIPLHIHVPLNGNVEVANYLINFKNLAIDSLDDSALVKFHMYLVKNASYFPNIVNGSWEMNLFTSEQLMFYVFKIICNILAKLENNFLVMDGESKYSYSSAGNINGIINSPHTNAAGITVFDCNNARREICAPFLTMCALYEKNFTRNGKIKVTPRIYSIVAIIAHKLEGFINLQCPIQNMHINSLFCILRSEIVEFGNNAAIHIGSTNIDYIRELKSIEQKITSSASAMSALNFNTNMTILSNCAATSLFVESNEQMQATKSAYLTEPINWNGRIVTLRDAIVVPFVETNNVSR